MKVFWIKEESDNKNFRIAERLGMPVCRLKNPEEIDEKIKNVIKENNYDTIVISNDIAGFSEDIIKKYNNNKNVNIIISTRK